MKDVEARMSPSSRQFGDEFDDLAGDMNLSDSDLEALMAGGTTPEGGGRAIESLEPGARVRGVVIDLRGGEVLVEIDSKTHGVIDETEFGAELPDIGRSLEANFERYDAKRELAVLSVSGARREVLWETLRPGMELYGVVSAVNKGGLTLDVKGIRAFLPISQIELQRVEDPSPYVGKKLRCEVTSFDRAQSNLVVSRRAILEREAEELRGKALARLGEGEVLSGTVVRLNEHGAFVDLGGVEGLLHASKIRDHRQEIGAGEALAVGQKVDVEIVRVDRERGRIGLDFKRLGASSWSQTVEGYSVGDDVAGWVTRLVPDGAVLSIEENVEGLIPRQHLLERETPVRRGDILRARITGIDRERKTIELKPEEE